MNSANHNNAITTRGRTQVDLSSISLVKLSDKNFPVWKSSIINLFNLTDLIDHLQAPITDGERANEEIKAQLYLMGTLNERTQLRVQGCATAFDMMQRIMLLHENYSQANVGRLLQKFFSYQKESVDSMADLIGKLEHMKDELKALGQPQTDMVFMSRIISCLPAGYETLKEIWEATDTQRQTVPSLVSRILKREEELATDQKTANLLAARKMLTIEEKKKVTKCAKCGHKGHWARECETEPEDYIPIKNKSETNKSEKHTDKRISL